LRQGWLQHGWPCVSPNPAQFSEGSFLLSLVTGFLDRGAKGQLIEAFTVDDNLFRTKINLD
jgi:hypothetical protein